MLAAAICGHADVIVNSTFEDQIEPALLGRSHVAPNDLERVRLKRIVDSMRGDIDVTIEEAEIENVSPQRGRKPAA